MKPRAPIALALLVTVLLFASTALGQVKKQEIINEIKEAFSTWEKVDCAGLKFQYEGELPSFLSEKEGGILVYFGHDNTTWGFEQDAYHTSTDFQLVAKGDLTKASIALNARDWWWSIGKEKSKIDIRTAVLHMIPGAIGFYVGHDPIHGSLQAFIGFDRVIHDLDPLHRTGAQFDYFKAGASCTQPAQPPICGMAAPPVDAGTVDAAVSDAAVTDAPIVDAGLPPNQLCIFHSEPNDPPTGKPLHWETLPIKYWVYIPDAGKLPGSTSVGGEGKKDAGNFDGGPVKACTTNNDCPEGFVCSDGGICVSGGGGGDDDGCCRVSHARTENLPGILLLLLGLVVLAMRTRRG